MGLKKKALGFIVIGAIALILGFFLFKGVGGQLDSIKDSEDDIDSSTVPEYTKNFCNEHKNQLCQSKDFLNVSDYPDTCIQKGEVVIQDPFDCTG